MNKTDLMPLRTVIGGVCARFVCRRCFTKYGYFHQAWCETAFMSEPDCGDCQYYSQHDHLCRHPARKKDGGITAK